MSKITLTFEEYQDIREMLARASAYDTLGVAALAALETLNGARWRTEEEEADEKDGKSTDADPVTCDESVLVMRMDLDSLSADNADYTGPNQTGVTIDRETFINQHKPRSVYVFVTETLNGTPPPGT